MKQAISAIFIAVLGTLTLVQAQQTPPVGKCSLTLAQAPKIRDVRLGGRRWLHNITTYARESLTHSHAGIRMRFCSSLG